ncbi:MAG: arginine repressor [Bacteroidales bacterium]
MNKGNRKKDIKKIISNNKISGQDELLELLKKMGYELTQATLSRDLKELGVAKIPDPEKGYIYVLPRQIGFSDTMTLTKNPPSNSVVSLDFSYNFGIIKTLPGFASSVAIYIDSFSYAEIAGTIAGDDTILVIPMEPNTSEEIKVILSKILSLA